MLTNAFLYGIYWRKFYLLIYIIFMEKDFNSVTNEAEIQWLTSRWAYVLLITVALAVAYALKGGMALAIMSSLSALCLACGSVFLWRAIVRSSGESLAEWLVATSLLGGVFCAACHLVVHVLCEVSWGIAWIYVVPAVIILIIAPLFRRKDDATEDLRGYMSDDSINRVLPPNDTDPLNDDD